MDDPFARASGPWYWRMDADVPVFGMRVGAHHVSIRGVCHGGVLMTFADMQSLPAGYMAGLIDRLVPTLTLTADFITPAAEGDWLELRSELLRRTGKSLFTQALVRSQRGDVVLRSSAVFRILSAPDPRGMIVRQILGLPDPA